MNEERRKKLDDIQTKLMDISDELRVLHTEEDEELDSLRPYEQNFDAFDAIENTMVLVDDAVEALGMFTEGA